MTKTSEEQLMRKINLLESDDRKNSLPAEELLNLISIDTSSNILDLGAGTGFLSIPAAKQTEGTVYALDFDPNILDYLAEKTKKENITNIQTVEGNFKDIPLEANLIDITLASIALHEVEPLSEALKDVNRVMKIGGHLLCIDFEKNEKSTGPRVHSSVMEEELRNAGFDIIETTFPTNKIIDQSLYIIVAQKKD